MKKAVEEVEKCRMTLKWTYAMAYYLAKGNEKELFEDNQRYRAFFCLVELYFDLSASGISNVLLRTSQNY